MKFTPWKNTHEFEETGEWLLTILQLPNDPNQNYHNTNLYSDPIVGNLQHAIHRVAIWRSRCTQGRLPHAVETTASLSELLCKDIFHLKSSSTMELRLAYAGALIRGVNGLADASQRQMHQGSNNQTTMTAASTSVATLCDRLGLPRWIVDMRHDASHSMLPSLSCLRLASRTLLGYLGERYWGVLYDRRRELRRQAWELLQKSCCEVIVSGNDESRKVTKAVNDSNGQEEGKEEVNGQDILNESRPKRMSPTKYAREYANSIPIDVAVQLALEYFVKGYEEGEDDKRSFSSGVFLTVGPFAKEGSSEKPKNFSNSKITLRYLPLIKVLQKTCCDFIHALFIELVHAIISIERQLHHSTNSINTTDEVSSSTQTDEISNKVDSNCSNLYSWIQYLLSREFYIAMHNQKSPPKHSVESKYYYMPYSSIKDQFHLPLNSICDICLHETVQEHHTHESDGISRYSYTLQVMSLLESILGPNNRKFYNGLAYGEELRQKYDLMNKKRKRAMDIEHAESQIIASHKDTDDDKDDSINFHNKMEKKKAIPNSKEMSLDDMEAFLSSSDSFENDGDEDDNDKNKEYHDKQTSKKKRINSNTIILGKHKDQVTKFIPVNDKDDGGLVDEVVTTESSFQNLSGSIWMRCESWDPCPIGALPGHV